MEGRCQSLNKQNSDCVCRLKRDAYRRRDPPAPHACDLEAALLHLVVGQLHMEVQLIVARAHDDVAALLREVRNARVKLDITVVLQRLRQSDELKRTRIHESCTFQRILWPQLTMCA